MAKPGLLGGFRRSGLGIDITDRQIKISEVSSVQGNIVVRNQVRRMLPPGTMQEGQIADIGKLRQTLKEALGAAKWRTRDVHVAVPGQMVMVRMLRMPNVSGSRLKKLVDFECKTNIMFPFDDPQYDFVKLDPVETAGGTADGGDGGKDARGNLRDVMLVAASRSALDQYVSLFSGARLKVKSMEIKAFSLLRLGRSMPGMSLDQTILLADVNETCCDLSVVHNGTLQITRNIPVSMEPEPADSGGGPPNGRPDAASPAVSGDEAYFDNACHEMISEMERMMNFYRYTLNKRDHQFGEIWLAGDLAKMDRLMAVMAERIHLPVRLMAVAPEGFGGEAAPAFAASVGLGLREVER
jgi:type IV pilus assembly protein PilM